MNRPGADVIRGRWVGRAAVCRMTGLRRRPAPLSGRGRHWCARTATPRGSGARAHAAPPPRQGVVHTVAVKIKLGASARSASRTTASSSPTPAPAAAAGPSRRSACTTPRPTQRHRDRLRARAVLAGRRRAADRARAGAPQGDRRLAEVQGPAGRRGHAEAAAGRRPTSARRTRPPLAAIGGDDAGRGHHAAQGEAGRASRRRPRRRAERRPTPGRGLSVLEEALEHLVKGIVDHPDDVRVDMTTGRRGRTLQVRVHPDDLGKVIGRGGRTATALRTVVSRRRRPRRPGRRRRHRPLTSTPIRRCRTRHGPGRHRPRPTASSGEVTVAGPTPTTRTRRFARRARPRCRRPGRAGAAARHGPRRRRSGGRWCVALRGRRTTGPPPRRCADALLVRSPSCRREPTIRRVPRPPAGRPATRSTATATVLGAVADVLHLPRRDRCCIVAGPDGTAETGAVRRGDRARGRPGRPARFVDRPAATACSLPIRRPDRRLSIADAHRRRHDLPGVPRRRCGSRCWAGRSRDGLIGLAVHDLRDWTHRPAPHRRRLPVRRRRRHGDEAGVWGGRWTTVAPDRGAGCRRSSCRRRRAAVHPAAAAELAAAGHGWCSPAAATRASTSGSSRTPASRMPVRELSIGDYVLAGGEAAVLVMVEAVARLLPGVLGNPASAGDDSFGAGASRAARVPASTPGRSSTGTLGAGGAALGHHGAIARWRRDEALRRTARDRPDLVAALDPARLDAATGRSWPLRLVTARPGRRRSRPDADFASGRPSGRLERLPCESAPRSCRGGPPCRSTAATHA